MDKIKKLITDTAKSTRNIYNQQEINDFINEIQKSKNIDNINIINWLHNNLRNYILREQPIKLIENLNNIVEDWAIKGVKNKTLSNVILDKELKDKILHVVDFLQSERKKDLSRLTIPEAIKKSIEWTENQKKIEDDLNGRITFLKLEDDYSIVEILSKDALLYEGSEMKHCIGLYYNEDIQLKKKRAFSLRDKDNKPHVTIMYDVKKNTIQEIKGSSNSIVKPIYQQYLTSFLNNFDFFEMNDYDYIPNINWDNNEFIYNSKVIKGRNYHSKFNFKNLHFEYYKKNDIKFLTSRDNVSLNTLVKHDDALLNIKFSFLELKKLNKLDISVLNKLNAKRILVSNVEQNVSTINNSSFENLTLINSNNNISIEEIKGENLKSLNINSKNELTIDKIDLSSAKNLEIINIKNCKIKNLILPNHELKEVKIVKTTVEQINDIYVNEYFINNSNINNEKIITNMLFTLDSNFNEELTVVKKAIISNDSLNIHCENKIDKNTVLIQNPNLLSPKLSSLYDQNTSLFFPEMFFYEKNEIKLENVNEKIVAICKPEYKKNINSLCFEIELNINFFNHLDYLDIPYVSNKFYKETPSLQKNNIFNSIYFKKEFANYLKDTNQLYQVLLFENLKMLSPGGVSIEDFSTIIEGSVCPVIVSLIEKTKLRTNYLQTEDYFKLIDEPLPKQANYFYFNTSDFIKNNKYLKDFISHPMFEKYINMASSTNKNERNIEEKKIEKIINEIDKIDDCIKNIDQFKSLLFSLNEQSLAFISIEQKKHLIEKLIYSSINNKEYNYDAMTCVKYTNKIILEHNLDIIFPREIFIKVASEYLNQEGAQKLTKNNNK